MRTLRAKDIADLQGFKGHVEGLGVARVKPGQRQGQIVSEADIAKIGHAALGGRFKFAAAF